MNQSLALDLKKLKLQLEAEPLPYVSLNIFRLKILNLILEYCSELKVNYSQLRFRPMKSRWGSCSEHGSITINTKLKNLPTELWELVVFHECLHLRYLHHGQEFKQSLRQKFADYSQREKLLKLYALIGL